MKTLALLIFLTVGLVAVNGCHWNHNHNHDHNSTGGTTSH